jgi:hypothetical protein
MERRVHVPARPLGYPGLPKKTRIERSTSVAPSEADVLDSVDRELNRAAGKPSNDSEPEADEPNERGTAASEGDG